MSTPLRLSSWNCLGKVHTKMALLYSQLPSVAVLVECGSKNTMETVAQEHKPANVVWIPTGDKKKLGVFCYGDYSAEIDSRFDPGITHVAPVRITGPVSFHLLAVYALHEQEPGERKKTIVGPLLRAIDQYRSYIQEMPTVVTGDFNNNVQWDKPGKKNNHQNVIDELGKLGLVSAYHTAHSEMAGHETHPTFFHLKNRDRPYHIDYCFVPAVWKVNGCKVGNAEDWLSFSDHMPLTVDLDVL